VIVILSYLHHKPVDLVVGLYCAGFINPIGVAAGVLRRRLALSVGSNEVGST
jgi:hypothetical protein